MSTETYTPDRLIAGSCECSTDTATLLSGQNLARGAILGMITRALGATTAGTNTGNGDVTGEAVGANTLVGAYVLTCTGAATNSGTFSVVAPDGRRLKDATVAVAYVTDEISFTIADGSTDYVAADSFSIAVAGGSGKLVIVDSTNVDGSNVPYAILATATDATSADKVCGVYKSGEFNDNAVVVGGEDTVAQHKEALRDVGIFLKATLHA